MLVLWKDGCFAADRKSVCCSGLLLPEQQRIFLLDQQRGALVFTGDVTAVPELLRAVGVGDEFLPEDLLPKNRTYDCLILRDGFLLRVTNGTSYILDHRQHIAIGPNSDVAVGAMYAGLSAEQSLAVWQNCSIFGGGRVEVCVCGDTTHEYVLRE